MKVRLWIAFLLTVASSAAELGTFSGSGDVGESPKRGSVEFTGGQYRITGSGANIWAKTDAFQFVWKRLSGDMAITADVEFVGAGVNSHRKAVLMIRQSLDAGSAYADVTVHGDGLTSLQYREEADGVTKEVRSELKAPRRLRIERRRDSILIFAGNPGEELKPAGPAVVAMKDPVYVGLGVCSHDATVLETAVFSNVRVESLAPPRPRYTSKVSILDLKDNSVKTVHTVPEIMEAPNWSRDGKYLLTNSRGRLFRIPVDGAAATELPLDPTLRCNNDHDFSPDGKRIAISASSATSRQSQVYVVNADGSNLKQVVSAAPSYFHGWSSDGRYLSFVAQRDGKNFDLFRIPAEGGQEERLTMSPGYDDGPDYSPDGKWIYFNSDRSGSWDVWRMPAAGAGPDDTKAQRVTSDEFEDWFPHPSPDGKWLIFFSFPKGTVGHNDRLLGARLRRIPLPRGNTIKPAKIDTMIEFFGGQGTINVNSWSPDSKRLAFVIYEPLGN